MERIARVKAETAPEEAVLEYLRAVDEGDVEAVNEVAHPEGEIYIEEGESIEFEVAVHDIEQQSLEEIAEADPDLDDQWVEETKQDLEGLVAEIGAEEYAIVNSTISTRESDKQEFGLLLVKDNGKWLIWGE